MRPYERKLQGARLEGRVARGPYQSSNDSGRKRIIAHRSIRSLGSVHFNVLLGAPA